MHIYGYKQNWGQLLGLASCPFSVLVSTILFRETIAPAVFILLLGLSIAWLLLELFIGKRAVVDSRKIPNPRWVAITRSIWLMGPWVCWADRIVHFTSLDLSRDVQLMILLVGYLGFGLRLSAVARLGHFFTYGIEAPEMLKLRTNGIYRWIRHPSFAGLLILTNLLGFVTGSFLGMLFLAVTIPNVVIRISQEERELEKHFGEDYIRYKASSHRLVPFFY